MCDESTYLELLGNSKSKLLWAVPKNKIDHGQNEHQFTWFTPSWATSMGHNYPNKSSKGSIKEDNNKERFGSPSHRIISLFPWKHSIEKPKHILSHHKPKP